MRARVATQLDEAAALDVVRADGETTGRQPSKAALAALRAVLRSPTTLTLVADDDGTVVGLLVAQLSGTELQLTLLCVHPDQRRRGVGRALVQALLERYPQVVDGTGDAAVRELLGRTRPQTGGHGEVPTTSDPAAAPARTAGAATRAAVGVGAWRTTASTRRPGSSGGPGSPSTPPTAGACGS